MNSLEIHRQRRRHTHTHDLYAQTEKHPHNNAVACTECPYVPTHRAITFHQAPGEYISRSNTGSVLSGFSL